MIDEALLKKIGERAVVKDRVLNEVLGLLDAAAAKVSGLHKTEGNEHNQRLLSGMYQGINSERAYVAEYVRANKELMPGFDDGNGL